LYRDAPSDSSDCPQLFLGIREARIERLLDDQDEHPGEKFSDVDLIGCSYQVVIGEKNFSRGLEVDSTYRGAG